MIEQTGETDANEVDQSRREAVLKAFKEVESKEPEKRIVIAQVKGKFFTFLMQVGRILIFAPLFIFLGFQFLLKLARPSA